MELKLISKCNYNIHLLFKDEDVSKKVILYPNQTLLLQALSNNIKIEPIGINVSKTNSIFRFIGLLLFSLFYYILLPFSDDNIFDVDVDLQDLLICNSVILTGFDHKQNYHVDIIYSSFMKNVYSYAGVYINMISNVPILYERNSKYNKKIIYKAYVEMFVNRTMVFYPILAIFLILFVYSILYFNGILLSFSIAVVISVLTAIFIITFLIYKKAKEAISKLGQ